MNEHSSSVGVSSLKKKPSNIKIVKRAPIILERVEIAEANPNLEIPEEEKPASKMAQIENKIPNMNKKDQSIRESEAKLQEMLNGNIPDSNGKKKILTQEDIEKKIADEQKVIGQNVGILNSLLNEKGIGIPSIESEIPADFANLGQQNLINSQANQDLSNVFSKLAKKSNPINDFHKSLNSKLSNILSQPPKVPKPMSKKPRHIQSVPSTPKLEEVVSSQEIPRQIHPATQIPGLQNLILGNNETSSGSNSQEEKMPDQRNEKLEMVDPNEINRLKAETAPPELNVTIDDFQKRIASGMIGGGPRNNSFGNFPSIGSGRNSFSNPFSFGFGPPQNSGKSSSNFLEKGFGDFSFGNILSSLQNKSQNLFDVDQHLQMPKSIPTGGSSEEMKKFLSGN